VHWEGISGVSMPRTPLFTISAAVILLLLTLLLFFFKLADRDLSSSHEARAAQDAESIVRDNQWLLPRLFDRKAELQKPPMYYWLVAAAAGLHGNSVDAWSVRFPAAISALVCVIMLYCFVVLRGRQLAGAVAAAVLATAVHYTWLGRVGRIDMPLTLAMGATLLAAYRGMWCLFERGSGGSQWFILAYLACAAAVLLKGPIGVVLPAAVLAVHLAVEGRLPPVTSLRRWLTLMHDLGLHWGTFLVFLLVLPWYVGTNASSDGRFFHEFLWKHNVERGLGGMAAHPWWFYGPRWAVDFLPWSLFLPVSGWLILRRGWWREDREARFGLVWLITITAVLSCSQFKRADYLLPAYPGAALFLGCAAERWWFVTARRRSSAAVFALTVVGCLLGWSVYVGHILPGQEPANRVRLFAQEIRDRAPAPQLILFFRTEAHALAFHVGRPIDTLLEWENLEAWAARPEVYHVVMPSQYAGQWSQHLKSARLEVVWRSNILGGSGHDDPLVLLRTHPGLPCSGP
jgi:4-amino-4-deoxy-L-arabinose transferase-like glycosyltransferase